LDPQKKKSFWKGVNKNDFSFDWMWDNVVYVNPCFLAIIGSKVNSPSGNP
jgi:hypothetical protein